MNSFGRMLRIQVFGESHGSELGVILDGVPPGIKIDKQELQNFLQRRRPNKQGTTPRKEADIADFKSGIIDDFTSGAPILITFANANVRSANYQQMHDIPRPNHTDLVARQKYFGYNEIRGGGHFSGRLTLGLVAAGFIAKQIIPEVDIKAEIYEVGGQKNYEEILLKAISNKDSLGGEIHCRVTKVPLGLGDPFFNSFESQLAHAIFSIPGVKGLSFGLGKSPAKSFGSDYNDSIINSSGKTKSNNSGGLVGGLTNGNDIEFSVIIKPTSSIGKQQESYSFSQDKPVKFNIPGRHDVCFALRVPVIIEAVTALVMADFYLQRLSEVAEYESRKNQR